ncbi:protein furry-like [Ornithodoros turicata]|uniref:protein furry-like n=1 Tax=Ornithodoros turicata TaxID=34597 RepID=UPI0031387CAF
MAKQSNAICDTKSWPVSTGVSNQPTSLLPWGARKERQPFPSGIQFDTDVKPGEFVLRVLFAEFTVQAEKKISAVLAEPLERPVSKSLQRGEDIVFDQLLSALGSVAEHCLPSLLRTLFAWYERQTVENPEFQRSRADSRAKGDAEQKVERDPLHERRDLAIEFVFCLVLIEVLKQLPLHPGHEDLVGYIDTLAFKHFRFRESSQTGPNAQNVNIVADLYAEVVGVLAQSRFQSVRKCFMAELKELRAKEPSPHTTQSIISLLMGMKFFRVKMAPIEEFEASFQFMQECATYFLEVKDKDIKHALAGLFVEILVPVAATVKTEVNVPCLKNFVEMLYSQTLDLCTKKKHSLALFPLVTCLLCVSQKLFFLQNWHCFLAMCLSHLKHRDPKMCRVALESLYRLLWVYMIRVKCESNTATQTRLQSIVNSLFPKGSKAVVPRDTPLNIFVKIIQFVAQERLDFAMKEIVFDLLSVGRPIKIILTPERMSIGLRAFLVVADSLQQKEGCPPMPRAVGVLPSGNTLRVKKTFINKVLTEDTAKSIGMSQYYYYVRKAFDDILKALDVQFGRPLMMTTVQNDIITGERKPKIDLFRTCVAAVPRLIPDGMRRQDLVDMLSRLTVHVDEELRGLAFQSLQNMMLDFPEWREDVIQGFVQFVLRDINDTFPQLLDNALRMLLQFLTSWKNALNSSQAVTREVSEIRIEQMTSVLHLVEGVALVMLCNCRLAPRRLAAHILKEAKTVMKILLPPRTEEPVVDIIDKACSSTVVEKCLPLLPASERSAVLSAATVDLQWLVERSSPAWTTGTQEGEIYRMDRSDDVSRMDAWCASMMGFIHQEHVLKHCPTAVTLSWPIVTARITSLFSVIELNPVNDNRASLLRTAPAKKVPSERDMYLSLWRNYLLYACRVAPSNSNITVRYLSPDLSFSSSPETLPSDRGEYRYTGISNSGISASNLFKQIVPLLRSEQADMRGAAALGLSHVNSMALKDLMEELVGYIREAIDRKQENVRRRRRRDILRLQLTKVMEAIAELGTFGVSSSILDRDASSLNTTFVEYIDGARLFLEGENEKDVPEIVQEIKLHFCNFIHKLIKSFSLECQTQLLGHDLRRNLFYLFASWSGNMGVPFGVTEKRPAESLTELELSALQAMSSVLCCGPCMDPPGLNEESVVYQWLDSLLASQQLYSLAQETVVLLLDFNQDAGALLDWLVDRCYTGDVRVADGCFNALATVFSVREYPCDHYMAIINVALLNAGCPRAEIHQTALQLLHILDHRFFHSTLAMDQDAKKLTEGLIINGYPGSQIQLSRQMARVHPELTMPMFSEITNRFQTARSSARQNLLQCLLPWLYNMELVDPHLVSHFGMMQHFGQEHCAGTLERKEGWGSAEATEMVLNNLFYITAKFGDEHPKEIEDLWASLCSCWPNNLKVIIRYLFIVMGLAPNELLPFTKRVVIYMARARPERLVDEIMAEVQMVETLNFTIERTETPPFFRLTSARKSSSHSEDGRSSNGLQVDIPEKGTLHTKRRSTEDSSDDRSNGKGSLRSNSSGMSRAEWSDDGRDNFALLREEAKPDTPQPHPLPMPEYGGFYAPLSEFLPDSSQPVASFHRCNLAIMLLTDVVVSGVQVEWSPHVPLLLHVIFLGLDHARPLVHEHCKKLLLSLLLVVAQHNDHFTMSRILLNNHTQQLGYGLPAHSLTRMKYDFTEPQKVALTASTRLVPGTDTMVSVRVKLAGNEAEPHDETQSMEDVVMCLVDFLASKKDCPLWAFEDITAKVWSVKSVEQLTTFLQHVLFVFKESMPLAHIQERWAQVSLQLALSCSSRHYAGRSLQVFRALKVPITTRMLVDILSRLVETVAEQGEDMQGYVTELMLTLEEAVDTLDPAIKISDLMREIFQSAPNIAGSRMSCPATCHVRSTSYSVSYPGRKAPESPDAKDLQTDTKLHGNSLGRSRSALSLKMADEQFVQEDKTALLAQFFWISVSLLDSDYEYEFLLALRLLERVLTKQPLDQTDFLEKAENIQHQMKWSNFPGVHALLLKGCSCPAAFDQTITVLSLLTQHLEVGVVDPSETLGFPFHVMALLPYLLLNYDEPTPLCTRVAESVAHVCMERSPKLENLATVMTLYSRRSFSKENSQWTKCVVKYLYDAYSPVFVNLLSFLVEMVEKGSPALTQHTLCVLYCALLYIDIHGAAQAINADLLRSISRHVEGTQWKDALKILKHVVTRSSTLAAPPSNVPSTLSTASADCVSIASSSSFAESEAKRELPGRTMEFTFDFSVTPIVGVGDSKNSASPRRSLSHNHSFSDNGSLGGWRRPWLSQGRTREHLVSLLTACGQRVGLPKSPSVIFSQTSDIQSSMCSSTEEVSAANNDASADSKLEDGTHSDPQFGVFKDFDFLEYELESQEGESIDNFNWGVRRRSPSNFEAPGADTSLATRSTTPRREESSDDEAGSVSPSEGFPALKSRPPGSPGSSQSFVSDGDLTLSNTSPSFSPLAAPLLDDAEDVWRSIVRRVLSSSPDESSAASVYPSLGRLLREAFRKVARMTRDACQMISGTDSMRRVGSLFVTALDSLTTELPFVFIDPQVMSVGESLRCLVLEQQEHWETFLEKREHVSEALDAVRSAAKLEALGDSISGDLVEEQKLDLCRALHRLHFQALLLLDGFRKLLEHLSVSSVQAHVLDLSEEVGTVRAEILRSVEDTESERLSPTPAAVGAMGPLEAEAVLAALLQGRHWAEAARHLHAHRSVLPGAPLAEDDDLEAVLGAYCRQLCQHHNGFVVVTRPDQDLRDTCHRLMDFSLQVSSALHALDTHTLDAGNPLFSKSEC